MQIQNLMIAAIQNLRKLLGYIGRGGTFEALRMTLSTNFIVVSARVCSRINRKVVTSGNINLFKSSSSFILGSL